MTSLVPFPSAVACRQCSAKPGRILNRAYFIRAQHSPCQGLSVLVPCVQPSLGVAADESPRWACNENIFEYNGGNKRKLHSYFPDPTMDIDNKVCSQLPDCLHCHDSADLFLIIALAIWCSMHPRCGLSAGVLGMLPL